MQFVDGFGGSHKEPIVSGKTYYCLAIGDGNFIYNIGFTRNLEDEGYANEQSKFDNETVERINSNYVAYFTIRPKHRETGDVFTGRAKMAASKLIIHYIKDGINIRKEVIANKKVAKSKDTNLYIKGYYKSGHLVDALIYTADTLPNDDEKIYYTTNLVIPEETQKVVHFVAAPGTPISQLNNMAYSVIYNNQQ